MNHLSDEQFEDLLKGQGTGRDHLDRCPACQDRLAEKRAMALRLRRAFSNLAPGENLAQRISSQLGLGTEQARLAKQGPKIVPIAGKARRVWTKGLSAVAALLLVVCILAFTLTPSTAQATQSTLAGIHTLNLSVDPHAFWADTDPGRLRDEYAKILGVEPHLPAVTETLKLCKCCVKRCITKYVVGSYVAGTAEGMMTVAIVYAAPESLGKGRAGPSGRIYYEAQQGECRMVATRIGDQTYAAVGKVGHRQLRALLELLGGAETLETHGATPSTSANIPLH